MMMLAQLYEARGGHLPSFGTCLLLLILGLLIAAVWFGVGVADGARGVSRVMVAVASVAWIVLLVLAVI